VSKVTPYLGAVVLAKRCQSGSRSATKVRPATAGFFIWGICQRTITLF